MFAGDVVEKLQAGARVADVRSLFDVGDSGGSDVTRHKDRYVGEAVEAEADRTTR